MNPDQKMFRLRRRIPVQNSPRRAYDQIRSSIRSGTISQGDQLVEDDLTHNYATSRNSVREALQTLAQEGLVTRSRGRGTLVSGAITELPMEHVVAGTSIRKTGPGRTRLTNEIIEIVVIPPSSLLRDKLRTESDVLLIEQIAVIDGPANVGTYYYVCPQEGRDQFVARVSRAHRKPGEFGSSLPTTHGVDIGRVEVTIEAVGCDRRTAGMLEVELGSPILLRERLIYDAHGTPVALDYVHFAPSRALTTSTYGGDPLWTPVDP
jgi:GntR family transcriptional regulator